MENIETNGAAAKTQLLKISAISPDMHARIFFMALAMLAGAAAGGAFGYYSGLQTMALLEMHHLEPPGIFSYLLPSIRQGVFTGALAGLFLGDLFCKSKRQLGVTVIALSCMAGGVGVVAAGAAAKAVYAGRSIADVPGADDDAPLGLRPTQS